MEYVKEEERFTIKDDGKCSECECVHSYTVIQTETVGDYYCGTRTNAWYENRWECKAFGANALEKCKQYRLNK